jgi:peptidoglycan hydrolase-like protein with peptidoglycan-binding domain
MPSKSSRRALSRAIAGHRKLSTGVAATAAAAGMLAAAAPAEASPYAGYLLLKGSKGPAVAEVQHALHIAADGVYGTQTRIAVIAFQRRRGLLVDGITGPQTWGALFGSGSTTSSYYRPAVTRSTHSYTAHTYNAPARTYSAPAHTYSARSSGYASSSGLVGCIISRESGGNAGAVNPNGHYGLGQWAQSTWLADGGGRYASTPLGASAAEQEQIIREQVAAGNSGQWTNYDGC